MFQECRRQGMIYNHMDTNTEVSLNWGKIKYFWQHKFGSNVNIRETHNEYSSVTYKYYNSFMQPCLPFQYSLLRRTSLMPPFPLNTSILSPPFTSTGWMVPGPTVLAIKRGGSQPYMVSTNTTWLESVMRNHLKLKYVQLLCRYLLVFLSGGGMTTVRPLSLFVLPARE